MECGGEVTLWEEEGGVEEKTGNVKIKECTGKHKKGGLGGQYTFFSVISFSSLISLFTSFVLVLHSPKKKARGVCVWCLPHPTRLLFLLEY